MSWKFVTHIFSRVTLMVCDVNRSDCSSGVTDCRNMDAVSDGLSLSLQIARPPSNFDCWLRVVNVRSMRPLPTRSKEDRAVTRIIVGYAKDGCSDHSLRSFNNNGKRRYKSSSTCNTWALVRIVPCRNEFSTESDFCNVQSSSAITLLSIPLHKSSISEHWLSLQNNKFQLRFLFCPRWRIYRNKKRTWSLSCFEGCRDIEWFE